MKKLHNRHDKSIKFKFKRCGLKIHNCMFNTDCEKIEFKDTAEAETGKQKDLLYKTDGKDAFHAEGQSTPITEPDVGRFYHYYLQALCDKSNDITILNSYCICTAKPQEDYYEYREGNITFRLPVFYTKNIDGTKVLST